MSFKSLPLAHRPHHDGSALYVPNQSPKLGEKLKIRIRVHSALGNVKEVRVRFSESGEAFPSDPAKIIGTQGSWTWYEGIITVHNPKMNYRFSILLENGQQLWVNAVGLHKLDQPDINDFRLNTFSSAPKWGPGTIMYQVFPDRFARSAAADKHKLPDWAIAAKWDDEVIGQGPGTSEQFFGGDLWGVIEHLDHLKKLGVTMLYLTPIFPGRSNHRYDASSFAEVDPLLGGNKALSALVEAAHKQGLKVIGDLTSNHSGAGHEWFQAAYKNPAAPESDFYYFTEKNTKYDSWFGVPSLPKFNWKSQELRKRFIEGKASVVAKWLKAPYNFDGWRIDVANMTGRIRDEDMYLEVAQIVRKTMVEVNPDTIMLGEYTGDAAYEVQGDGWQGAMTYANFTRPLWRFMFNTKTSEKYFQNMGYIGHPETAKDFVESHTRFAAAFPWHVRLNNMNALDTHDTPRFKSYTIAGAQRVAAGLQFTFPGIPVVWAGDEFGLDGFNGEKSRTPIPWNGERPTDPSMIELYANLAQVRKANSALVDGSLRWLYASDEAMVFIRENAKQSILVVATRGKDDKIEVPIDSAVGLDKAERLYGSAKLKAGKKYAKISAGKVELTVWRLPAAK
ncbi:MAG: glycoside hydrolase family 13 protein [Micrococcales bacterium]